MFIIPYCSCWQQLQLLQLLAVAPITSGTGAYEGPKVRGSKVALKRLARFQRHCDSRNANGHCGLGIGLVCLVGLVWFGFFFGLAGDHFFSFGGLLFFWSPTKIEIDKWAKWVSSPSSLRARTRALVNRFVLKPENPSMLTELCHAVSLSLLPFLCFSVSFVPCGFGPRHSLAAVVLLRLLLPLPWPALNFPLVCLQWTLPFALRFCCCLSCPCPARESFACVAEAQWLWQSRAQPPTTMSS